MQNEEQTGKKYHKKVLEKITQKSQRGKTRIIAMRKTWEKNHKAMEKAKLEYKTQIKKRKKNVTDTEGAAQWDGISHWVILYSLFISASLYN